MIKLTQKTNKSALTKLINIETSSINASLDSQKSFSKQILIFLQGFIGNIETDSILSNKINKFLADTSTYLTKINSNISLYNNLLEMLDNIKADFSKLDYETNIASVTEYNKKYKSYSNKIFKTNADIETFIHYMTSIDISEYISLEDIEEVSDISLDDDVSNKIENITEKKIVKKENDTSLVEDTLIISEIKGTVTLPYKISNLQEVLHNKPEKYNSLSDVVLSKYTIPIKNYKFSAISRFKEAYKLIIEREHGTKKAAINLATELFSNYNLHPAIITACKNLNELDVYLSCLEFNELEDFHFFNIVYDALPVTAKVKPAF